MERFAVRNGITLTVEYGLDRIACQLLYVRSSSCRTSETPCDDIREIGIRTSTSDCAGAIEAGNLLGSLGHEAEPGEAGRRLRGR